MEQIEATISFASLSAAEASKMAQELEEHLAKVDGVESRTERHRPEAQDLGSILVLLFGTGSAVAVARGLGTFLAKRGTTVKIKTAAGEIEIVGTSKPEDVLAAAAKLFHR